MTDFTVEPSREPILLRLARPIGTAVVAVGRLVGRLVAAEIDRRRTAALLELDDAHLRDIGVSRGEVYGALLTTAGEKASEHLSRVRNDRRQAERSQIRERARQARDAA